MSALNWLAKPEYLWRPQQILRRVVSSRKPERRVLPLPWGTGIYAHPAETIGFAIATQGVYDLPVTEALTRLTDPGETVLDVGANIGYMSLVLARAAGAAGRVIAFEPNPVLLPILCRNIDSWKQLPIARIEMQSVAISCDSGQVTLHVPDHFDENEGTASLESGSGRKVSVGASRLDDLNIEAAGVMKVDVEGHEWAVFAGGARMLGGQRIRDIVFEEHQPYPARSHQLLLDHGYRIYKLTRTTFRPLLVPPEQASRQAYLPTNFIATRDPQRAEKRLSGWGWRVL